VVVQNLVHWGACEVEAQSALAMKHPTNDRLLGLWIMEVFCQLLRWHLDGDKTTNLWCSSVKIFSLSLHSAVHTNGFNRPLKNQFYGQLADDKTIVREHFNSHRFDRWRQQSTVMAGLMESNWTSRRHQQTVANSSTQLAKS